MNVQLNLPHSLDDIKTCNHIAQDQMMEENRIHMQRAGVPDECLECGHSYINDMDVFTCWDECEVEDD